jgi:hypothetical protein
VHAVVHPGVFAGRVEPRVQVDEVTSKVPWLPLPGL